MTARKSYQAFDQGWDNVEDDVKSSSPAAYRAIEDAMDEVKTSLGAGADKPDPAKTREALTRLRQTIDSKLPTLG